MRRPHVYERSAPRSSRTAYHEPNGDPGAVAREVASVLAGLVSRAERSALPALAGALRQALVEADAACRVETPPAAPHPGERRGDAEEVS